MSSGAGIRYDQQPMVNLATMPIGMVAAEPDSRIGRQSQTSWAASIAKALGATRRSRLQSAHLM